MWPDARRPQTSRPRPPAHSRPAVRTRQPGGL